MEEKKAGMGPLTMFTSVHALEVIKQKQPDVTVTVAFHTLCLFQLQST